MTARTVGRTLSIARLGLLAGLITVSACAAMGDSPRSRGAARPTTPTTAPTVPAAAPTQGGQSQSSQAKFQIDRRPVKSINTFNGNLNHKYGRQNLWGQDDDTAMNWLEKQLNIGYNNGYRRFVLILPAGRDRDTQLMSGSHWYSLEPSRRERLKEFFPSWIASHPGVSLGIYTGFDLDPNPNDVEYANHRLAKFDNETDRQLLWEQMAPWFEECGFREVWWDYASPPGRRDEAVKFSQWLAEKGIKAGGEAMPRVLPTYNGKLDNHYVESMPWMALPKYFRQHDKAKKWRVDPNTTEMFFAVRPGDKATDMEMLSAFQRGFIPWVYSNDLDVHVMKLWNQANGEGIKFEPAPQPVTAPAAAAPQKTGARSGRRHR